MKGLFCGSFYPITTGHLDIIERAAALCDTLYVAVANNQSKEYQISLQDRTELVKIATAHIPNVCVMDCLGLVADFCVQHKIDVIIKSGRNALDLQYEMDMAELNKGLCGVQTIFLASNKEYSHISSSYVRELACHGAALTNLVPSAVEDKISNLLKRK